jgi:hypothetical protein
MRWETVRHRPIPAFQRLAIVLWGEVPRRNFEFAFSGLSQARNSSVIQVTS